MDDAQFAELAGWISGAGLGGQDETTIVTELCTRLVAHGVPLARAQVFIDTLHPIHGGRSYFWQAAKGETIATEYGQVIEGAALARWRKSVFYRLLETGDFDVAAATDEGRRVPSSHSWASSTRAA